MARNLAPPPTIVAGRRIVAPDVERVDVNLQFDVADETATGEATVYFHAGGAHRPSRP